jgi:hypothetical protein
MSLDKNIVVIIGRATKDVEVRTFKGVNGEFQKAIFTVATNYTRTNKNTVPPTKIEETEFHRCFAKGAMVAGASYIKKGQYVSLTGRLKSREYEEHLEAPGIGKLYLPGADGKNVPLMVKRYITEIQVFELGLEPKSWSQPASGQAAPPAPAGGNVVYGSAAPATTGAAPMPPATPQAAAQAAADAAFAASNGTIANL